MVLAFSGEGGLTKMEMCFVQWPVKDLSLPLFHLKDSCFSDTNRPNVH